MLRFVAAVTTGTVLGLILAGGGAYLYLMGYTPLFEERLHHF
ncbi:hypothetical protein [Mycolicibacterium canariasense]|nr:hypothetical protein [Mycolicibacterium canariasense]